MRASVLKCYILRGNYHASLQRLSIELSLASGASRVTELTAELLREVAELQRRLEGWRPEQSDKARHLFYAAHAKALRASRSRSSRMRRPARRQCPRSSRRCSTSTAARSSS